MNNKTFSTANLFFICVFLIFIFEYFHYNFEKNIKLNPFLSVVAIVLAIVGFPVYLYLKFPLFIKLEEKSDISVYKNIYFKNIGFWSKLYIGIFYLTGISKTISLFGQKTLKFGFDEKKCKFIFSNTARFTDKFFDIILTIICGVLSFYISKEFSKFGVFFGILFSFLSILFIFRKIILNYIFSVNIGKYEGYKLNIMYPYSLFDGIFSKIYGLAYYTNDVILVHNKIFCGNDALKKYVLTHEVGHLKTAGRKKNFWSIFIFVVMTFLSITGIGLLSQINNNKNDLIMWIPAIIYIIFAFFYKKIMDRKNENDELKADIYAIKVIGKEAVLRGLEIIKSENISEKIRFSGISINRRIEFVREYQEQQLNKTT